MSRAAGTWLLALAAALLAVGARAAPAPAQGMSELYFYSICGGDGQRACTRAGEMYACYIFFPCWTTEYYCYDGAVLDRTTNRCYKAEFASVVQCCTRVSFTADGYRVTQGYYARVTIAAPVPGSSLDPVVVPSPGVPANSCTTNRDYPEPVQTVAAWQGKPAYTAALMINANFFEIVDYSGPYGFPCTRSLGLLVSNGSVVQSDTARVHGSPTDALVFYSEAGIDAGKPLAEVVSNADLAALVARGYVHDAVSGFRMVHNGAAVPVPESVHPAAHLARTAIGLRSDRKTLVVVVVQPGPVDGDPGDGGTSVPALAQYLISLGVTEALNLDGAGSSQLRYVDASGRVTELPPGDERPTGNAYRPVPSVIGFRGQLNP
jgi:hypothetical protein